MWRRAWVNNSRSRIVCLEFIFGAHLHRLTAAVHRESMAARTHRWRADHQLLSCARWVGRTHTHVRQLLALIHALPLPTSLRLEDMERTVSISATDYAQRIIVGDLVRALRRAAPKVNVKISNIESATLVRRMQEGEIDVALTSNGYVPEGLLSLPLWTERYVCVAGRPLTDGPGVLDLASLVEHDFLVVSPGVPSFDGSAGSWFEQQGLRRRVVASVPSFFMAMEYLRQSDMVAFIPSRLLPGAGLFEVPLAKYPPGFQVVAAYRPCAMSDPLQAWVLDCVRAHCAAAS